MPHAGNLLQHTQQKAVKGLVCAELQEPLKLSKAQRKNMRRAEKKAAERHTERMSAASSELVSELDLVSIEGDAFEHIAEVPEEGEEEEEETTVFPFNGLSSECTHVRTNPSPCTQGLGQLLKSKRPK